MAEKVVWKVSQVKFKEGVLSPESTSQLRTEFREAKELQIEFDMTLRLIVLTHMRPGAKETDPRVPNPDRPPVTSPIENVIWMR